MSAWGRVTPCQFSPDTGGGILLSKDNGASWRQVLAKDQHTVQKTGEKHGTG